jgi:hypothetical protein
MYSFKNKLYSCLSFRRRRNPIAFIKGFLLRRNDKQLKLKDEKVQFVRHELPENIFVIRDNM